MLYIKNAEIYTPSEIIKKSYILINGLKIARISKRPLSNLPNDTKTLDIKGRIVAPGFIDLHLQGAGGYDFLDATKEALWGICNILPKFGTTSFLATTVFKNGKNPHIENVVKGWMRDEGRGTRDERRGTRGVGAQILGIHLEGPFVNPKKKGMIRPDGIRGCSVNYLDKILRLTKDKLRMMTIAPELKGALAVISRLRKENIIASFGHSEASYEETKKGINKGITHVTHIFNAMKSIHHRDPGPLPAILMEDKISIQLIGDGVHLHPVIIRLILKLKGIKNIVLITDSMSSLGLPDGRYRYDGWEYESKNGACRYEDGTLIGTSLPLNKMLKRMIDFGRVTLSEAIQTVTTNPARILQINNRKGSIEEGKDADLVIMDKDLGVFMTLIGGEIAYRRDKKEFQRKERL